MDTLITPVILIVVFIIAPSVFRFLYYRKKSVSKLNNHNVFSTTSIMKKKLDEFVNDKNHDEVSMMIRQLLLIKIQTVEMRLSNFINNKFVDKCKPVQMKLEFATLLSALMNDYYDKAINIIEKSSNVSITEARQLIELYDKFINYVSEDLSKEIDLIVFDDNYTNNFDKINSIFYLISTQLHHLPIEAEYLFNLNNVNNERK